MKKVLIILIAILLSGFRTDLPFNLFPSQSKNNFPLVIFISGDGGWESFDQKVCENLAENGMPVVGIDARKYFWIAKEPSEAAGEFEETVKHYLLEWNKKSFILVGYSFGACVAPVIANSFTKSTIGFTGIYCISPDETTDLEIHISDMLSIGPIEKFDVLTELEKLTPLKPVCLFGADEDIEIRKHFSISGIRVETLPGGHRFNNNTVAVAKFILKDF
jgi:type IV secretory pathway VirJ component